MRNLIHQTVEVASTTTNQPGMIRTFTSVFTCILLLISIEALSQRVLDPPFGGGGYVITAPATSENINETITYYVDYSGLNMVSSPNWVASGGSVSSTWISGGKYHAQINWNTIGYRQLEFKSGLTTKASRYISILPVATISGTSSPYEGQTVTYTHNGTLSNGAVASDYSWSLSGGVITSENKSARSVTIRWTSQGSRNLHLRFSKGLGGTFTLDSRTISVQAPNVTGTTSVTHGSSATYTHTGQGTLSGYSWVADGGTITNENDQARQVTVRWDPSTSGTRKIKLYYNSSFKKDRTVTVNMPSITGPSSATLNDSQTFTHGAGYASSHYTWSPVRGTVTNTNNTTKQATVRWTDGGTNKVSLYYKGYLLGYKSVSVSAITLSGSSSTTHGQSATYTHNGGGTLSNYNYTVSGGSITNENDGAKQVTIRWTSTGSRSFSIRYGSTTQASKSVTVLAPSISGSTSVARNGEITYTHAGGFGSSNYTWTASSGGTVLSTNNSAKSTVIRWSTTGTKTVTLYYAGVQLSTRTVNVAAVAISGASSATHGNTVTYTHNGAGNLSNYNWTPSGGTIISENDAAKQVSIRWTSTGSRSLTLKYGTTTQATKTTTVSAATISGVTSSNMNRQITYSHSGGYGSSNYTWSTTGGTIVSVNNSAKTVVIRWNVGGAQTLSLHHSGALMDTHTITVNPINISGSTSALHGATALFTHNGEGTLTNYDWTVSGGSVISTNHASKSVTVRFTSLGSRSVSVRYLGSTQDGHGVSVTAPAITGPATAARNDSKTYTHGGGFSSSLYTWGATGGTVLSDHDGNKTGTIRWTSSGTRTAHLYYNGALLKNYNVSVSSVTIAGSASATHGSTVTYTHNGGGTLSNYNWTVSGGSITNENDNAKQVTVRWTTLGSRSLSVRYNTTTQASKNVTVNAPAITGPSTALKNDSKTYTHGGGFSSSLYTWGATGGTVLSDHDGNKTGTIRWTSSGTRTAHLYYNGNLLKSYNVTVAGISVSGDATATHGYSDHYTHNGGGTLTNYNWTVVGGSIIGEDDNLKRVTIRWNTLGTNRSVSVRYNTTTQASRTVTVNAPSITGTNTADMNEEITYTHGGGFSSSLYTWGATGGTVLSDHDGNKTGTIRWTSSGAKTAHLYYNGNLLKSYNVTVAGISVSGDATATHGYSDHYTHNGGGTLTNYNWTVVGGSIIGEDDNLKRVTIRWNTLGTNRSVSVRYNTTTQASRTVTVNAPSITGTNTADMNEEITYTHGGGFSSSLYTWGATGGTVLSDHDANKTGTIRWTSAGTRTAHLYYNGNLLKSYNVTVAGISVSGDATATHGYSDHYTHNGGGTLSNYNWTVVGGSIIGEDDNLKRVTIRWNTLGTNRSVSVRYLTTTQASRTVTVNAPAITGSTTSGRNEEITYTHGGGFSSSLYTWGATGGTVLGDNDANKTGTIRWTSSGATTAHLYYDGNLLQSYNVTVAGISVSGSATSDHGYTRTYTHNGVGNLNMYSWTANGGGTVVSENDALKQATIRWETAGSRSVSVRFNGATQASKTVSVSTPGITGVTSPVLNHEVTYTHQGGYTSSNYHWIATGGTIVGSSNASTNKNVVVHWTATSGTLELRHNTQSLTTINVTPLPITITGSNPSIHGETERFTHNGGVPYGDYSWTTGGGTLVAQNDVLRNVDMKWDALGSSTVSLYYRGNLMAQKTITNPAPTISGPGETILDRTADIYTHSSQGNVGEYTWEAVGGAILSQDPLLKQVIVKWEDPSGTLRLKHNATTLTTKSITGLDPVFVSATKGTNLQSASPLTLKAVDTYSNYQWYKDEVAFSTNATLSITAPGDYQLKHVRPSGFELYSNTVTIIDQPFWDQEKNMIVTYDVREEGIDAADYETLTATQAHQTVNYLDGLSRPLQTIAKAQGFDGKDIVQPYQYDRKGRVAKSYLPYVADQTTGFYRDLALENDLLARAYNQSEQQDYYANDADVVNDASPFAHSVFEDNPRGRVIEQGSVGADWQPGTGHTSRYTYRFNTATEVRKWGANGTTSSYYPANTLRVVEMLDENDNSVLTYTNARGWQVLKKVEANPGEWLETYSIYDLRGRLRYTISPEGMETLGTGSTLTLTTPFINDWVHVYTYDDEGRLVEKKVPGASPEYYVYDEMDRLILSQNGKLRTSNQWSFVKYDRKNRLVYSGLYTNATETNRTAVQGLVDALDYDTQPYYEREAVNATYHGYTNGAFPTANTSLHAVVYYDSYDYDRNGTDDVTYDASHLVNLPASNHPALVGQVTGGKTRILGTSTWLLSTTFYDHRGRAVQTRAEHHLGGTDVASAEFNFQGQVLKTKTTHTNGADVTNETRRYEYHTNGALIKSYHQLNNEPERMLSELNYSNLGELREKNLYSEDDGSHFLQSVDFSYNIRGWLTAINDAALSQEADDLFGMELSYNTSVAGLGNTQYHNGNISAIQWSGYSEEATTPTRAYTYSYDQANRLTAANPLVNLSGWTANTDHQLSNLTYDKNGNIETLDRKGAGGENKDQLAYHYQANQLQYIDDTWDDAAGFVDGNTSGADYAYDSSGNLTQDLNKNIGSISYNHLNLPTEVLLNVPEGPDKLTYTYSAGGRKLKMQVWEGTTLVKTIDYAGAYHYENDQLTYVHNEEGRIVVDAQGKVDYQVYLTDHQGNTRRVISTVLEVYESVEDMEGDVYKGFSSIPKVTNVNANSTTGGNKVGVLNSGETGALIFLKMDKGDTVDLSVVANYETAPSGSTFLGTGYSALFGAFDQSFGSGVENGVSSSATDFSTALSGVAMAGKSGNAGTAPKAYLNYIIFDREMNYEHAGFTQISTTAQGIGSQEAISLDDIIAGQAGYLLAYLSNENQEPVAVNFDDFTVRHAKTNVVQAVDYYPFGMEAVSYTRTAADPNQYLYNAGAELNDLTGYYETFYRNYDASIGRFHSIDPVASKYGSLTPYNYAFNDPVFWNDPLGDDPGGDGPFERVEGDRNSLNGGGDFGWNQFISRLTGNHWGTFARYGVHGADYGNPYAEGSSLYWDYVGYQLDGASFGNSSALEYLENQFGDVMVYNRGLDEWVSAGEIISVTNPNQNEGYRQSALDAIAQTNGGGQYIGPGSTTYNRFNTGSSFGDSFSTAVTAGGIYAGGSEFSLRNGGQWKGANGKWNSLKWGGNGATGARSAAVSGANIAKGIGKGTFLLGAGISVWELNNNRTWEQAGQSGLDVGMGAVGTWGGPIGWVVSGAYFVDQFLRDVSPGYKNFQETQSRLNQQYGRSYLPCFVAGTLIYTEDGLKPIEELKEGTKVYSYNFETDSVELQAITKFFTKEVQEVYEVKVGKERINVTAEHPFYVEGKNWVKVKELTQGDQLKMSDGSTVEISSISKSKTSTTVYNIEVAGNHNYYVTATKLLVHNKNIGDINELESELIKREDQPKDEK